MKRLPSLGNPHLRCRARFLWRLVLRQGNQRLAKREIDLHRAGRLGAAGRHGATGGGANVSHGVRTAFRQRHLDAPFHMASVDLRLVNGLRGADVL